MQVRNEKVLIKITELKSALLQIEPMSRKDYSSDLSVEFTILKRQLREYGLNVDEDFVENPGPCPHTSRRYLLEFHGRSRVVRALCSIPSDIIGSVYYALEGNALKISKLCYTLSLTEKECYVSEVAHVKQAQTSIFNDLVKDILQIHSQYSQINSSVINQLNNEIHFLSKRPDPIFVNTNFILLVAALHHASCVEKASPTVVSDSFSLFKKESIILGSYEKLIIQCMPYLPVSLKECTNYSTCLSVGKISACYQQLVQENMVLGLSHTK